MPPSLGNFGAMNRDDEVSTASLKAAPGKATKKASTRIKYKKAPGAPRRFKSAYMFFSTEKHRSIREELAEKGKSEKTTTIAKLVSKAWKELSQEERDSWEERASQDKARYEVEKTMYTGPWKIPAKKRTAKDPNAPKRPMSAFLSFSHAKRAEVKEAHPNMSNAEISRVLAQLWKEAPDDAKKDHVDQEFSLRQEYKSAIAIWRENSEREMASQRKVREDMALRTVAANKQGIASAEHEDNSTRKSAEVPPGGGAHDAGAYPYPPSQYGAYAQDLYPPYGGSSAPYGYPPYPHAGPDARDPSYPSMDGYGGGPPPYGYYPPYGGDLYGSATGYGAAAYAGGAASSGASRDYQAGTGQSGAYAPSYYGAGQDGRYAEAEAQWNGENSRSPARAASVLNGRLQAAASGLSKHF